MPSQPALPDSSPANGRSVGQPRSARHARLRLLIGAAAPAAFLLPAAVAQAASFTVSDTTDAALSNPAGTACVSTDGGACTLRAAVQAADNAGGASTITLPTGTYKLTIAPSSANDAANGDLDINGTTTAITVTGAGAASTTINANDIDRAFAVQAGESLSISGVRIDNGATTTSAPRSNSTDAGYGGASAICPGQAAVTTAPTRPR